MTTQLTADGSWRIDRLLHYDRTHRIIDGIPQFGFHLAPGTVFIVEYEPGYIGLIRRGRLQWTAGAHNPGLADRHVDVALEEPRFVGVGTAGGAVLVTDARHIWRVDVDSAKFELIAAACDLRLVDPGNAIWIEDSGIWVNDIAGHQIVHLTSEGELVERVGDGTDGFQAGTVGFDQARFGGIYDMRSGPDGRLYVLDSSNYAVRVVDPARRQVETICGDGIPGSRGDGGPSRRARLGGDPEADFDGPWSLVVDDSGTLYIGDTHNRAVRRIDAASGQISTIAHSGMSAGNEGGRAADAASGGELFTLICGMDLDRENARLLVPDWVSDDADALIALKPSLDR